MTYYNYVVLFHSIVILIALSYALYASLFLLLKKPKKSMTVSRTPAVYLYFCFIVSSSIFLIIYMLYTVFWWRPGEAIYNPMILYYVAGLPTIFINLVPVADFFLCLDRCFCVGFPFIYRRTFPLTVGAIFAGTDVTILLIYFISTKYFSYYTSNPTTTCFYYICLVWQLNYPLIMGYVKLIFSIANLITTIILIILNFWRSSPQLVNKLNKPVILISAITLCFAFLPGFIIDIVNRLTGLNAPDYIGDTNLTCLGIGHALSAHLYCRVYKKHLMQHGASTKILSPSAPSGPSGTMIAVT